jgi:hypothetical protein
MNEVPAGTASKNHLSGHQKVAMTLIWLGIMGAIFGLGILVPTLDGSPVFGIIVVVLVILGWVFTFKIALRPAGKPYLQITTVAGLRGEFSVARQWPGIIGIWVGMIALVCIMAIPSEPKGAPVIYGWALTGIIPLLVYGFLLVRALDRVTAFRVEDDGSLFIRRGQRAWEPLRLSDYGRVVTRTISGRYGTNLPSRIDFLDPLAASVKPFNIPVMYVRSRQYGTMAYGTLIHDFFREMYTRLGYYIEEKNGRWEARPKIKRPKLHE